MSLPEPPYRSTPASRAFTIFAGLILVTAAFVLIGLKFIADARAQAFKATAQSEANHEVLKELREIQRVILAVTGCTEEMTDQECQDLLKQASTAEGDRRIREVDCRTYRALRGEPPLGPGEKCLPPDPPADAASQSGDG